MDFACDLCGRRYFVPDELVQGRAFRAKCDDCDHAFTVHVPDALGATAPQAAAEREPSGQALSDADLAEISSGLGPLLPEWPDPADASVPGFTSWPEPVEEPPLPLPSLPPWSEPLRAAPAAAAPAPPPRAPGTAPVAAAPMASTPSRRPEPSRPAPVASPAAKLRLPGDPARRSTTQPRAPAAEPALPSRTVPGAAPSTRRPELARAEPGRTEPVGRVRGPISDPSPSPTVDAPLEEAREEPASARVERPPETKPEAAPAAASALEPAAARARRGKPEPEGDASGLTEEDIIAAGTRHRHLWGIAAGVGLLVACALGALLFSRMGRPGEHAAHATAAPAGAAQATGGTVPFDASSLAFRGNRAPPSRDGAKAAPGRKRRRVAVRLDDRKLFDLLGKKDDVAMDAPKDEVELDSAKDVLDPVAVERTVAASRRAFDACVTKALRLNPGLRVSKRATLIVTVEPSGKVTGGWIAEEQLEGTELGRCLVTASSRMSFPTFEGEAIDVSIPLSLSAVQ